ncbi:MAG: NYN domain-containing protein [Schwartzia sp.]|nr:NYN domain-containing protein [Schwartzia sp. (in: firmicutes)]
MGRKREHYIIDGYNVIHSWPELERLSKGELAEARDRLIHVMQEYGAYENFDVTIVFDALFTTDEAHEEKRGRHLTVIYTAPGETADSYIERLAYESVREEREVHVVTSDGAEQSVILGAGAYRLPSRELLKNVKRVKKLLQKEFLRPITQSVSRNEIGGRIDQDTAALLDAMRKKRN